MLIIRGINVFPSQVESVVLSLPEFAPRYMLVVDREKNLDTLLVQVELRQEVFTSTFDTPAAVDALEKKLANNSNELLMQFKVYMDELQDTYFKINDLISEQNEIDEEVGAKMAAALQKIIGEWRP
jgi:phenylacetate-coenzyme A ligase PaaK-like adenylate-forming protein